MGREMRRRPVRVKRSLVVRNGRRGEEGGKEVGSGGGTEKG
jgi:hypothetical protein